MDGVLHISIYIKDCEEIIITLEVSNDFLQNYLYVERV